MFWRTNRNAEMLAAIARLEQRMYDIEGAICIICDHVEAVEVELRRPRVARVIPQWPADGRSTVQ
jgi:hypothetical protein